LSFFPRTKESCPLSSKKVYTKPIDYHRVNLVDFATETNNDHFEVERSQDGITFEFVNSVKANGDVNSNVIQTYISSDNEPYTGLSYYRIKQVDKNGGYKYSNIASVNFAKRSFVSVYPNPANTQLTIEASSDYLNSKATIMNTLGESVRTSVISSFQNSLDISGLAGGVYYIVIENGTDFNKIKIIVQK
jgi:hypothetical protein